MTSLRFAHPEPIHQRPRIIPVFLPYHGCPHRCIYCAQHLQTGSGQCGQPIADDPTRASQNLSALEAIHAEMVQNLTELAATGAKNRGIAFYGGTFTALPTQWQQRFLDTARTFREDGTISHVRCSTRPDKAAKAHLQQLRENGLDMVELGIQSFQPDVLEQTRRGYPPATAVQACRAVRASGLELGIQLMPGLPGSGLAGWFRDIDQTRSLNPNVVRIYPCMVLDGTELGRAYLAGTYRPWSLARTLWAVSHALVLLWRRAIPVIRIGLAPEQSLFPAILAGPWHPALGHMAKSHALRDAIVQAMTGVHRHHHEKSPEQVHVLSREQPLRAWIPRRYAAEFWGHGREHARTWHRLGLPKANVHHWERPYFMISGP
ncbi:elongator complex protein 3 [Desulfonatronum thioautotrophicum]|uniref:elongator complex protein 3 n=1 Tax=Desulfonatronum thioautotrophicum TaxID=617001 RepID=UPI0005EB20E3|nr:radical SAM protein [Desulfonatronum thioautotrophicum]